MNKTPYAPSAGMSLLLELGLGTAQQLGQKMEARTNRNSRRRIMDDDDIQDYVRPWVGLTNDELTDLLYNPNLGQASAVLQAIALLKERNT